MQGLNPPQHRGIAHGHGRRHRQKPSLPDRCERLYLPGVPRPAPADAQVGRAPRRRSRRLLQHAVQDAGGAERRRATDPFCLHLRCLGQDIPQRLLPRVQDEPVRDAGGTDPAIPAGAPGVGRLRGACHRADRVRGRRYHRNLRPRGRGQRCARDDRVLGQGPDAADHRQGADARPDEEQADGPRGCDREIRRRPGTCRRCAIPRGRPGGQRARRAGHRREDRRAADHRVRQRRGAAGARGRDQAAEAARDADRVCRPGAHLETPRDAER